MKLKSLRNNVHQQWSLQTQFLIHAKDQQLGDPLDAHNLNRQSGILPLGFSPSWHLLPSVHVMSKELCLIWLFATEVSSSNASPQSFISSSRGSVRKSLGTVSAHVASDSHKYIQISFKHAFCRRCVIRHVSATGNMFNKKKNQNLRAHASGRKLSPPQEGRVSLKKRELSCVQILEP